jgi:rod shape-determining protein MreC
VHDKVVRRRRAVLGLLVAVSLILLTAYFGESPSSPLHSVQRGIVQVLSPVQSGAATVLSPVRDVAGWVSDTLRAKSQVDRLRTEVAQLTLRNSELQYESLQNQQLSRQVKLDQNIGLSRYSLVSANVTDRDPSVWYQQVTVDRGSADGVRQGDPVVADGALVGDVTTVTSSSSIVTLITDHSSSVAAKVLDGRGDDGLLSPAVGAENELVLQDLPATANISVGQQVVTEGFSSGTLQDLYPAAIPIGTVSNVNPSTLYNNNEVTVSPSADLRHFTFVQILTAPHAGDLRAQVPTG